jgi:hypothetical protein
VSYCNRLRCPCGGTLSNTDRRLLLGVGDSRQEAFISAILSDVSSQALGRGCFFLLTPVKVRVSTE